MSDGTVHERMARVMAALSYIPKGRSAGVAYEFRGIDALFNELHEHLADEELFMSPRVLDDWQVNLIPGSPDKQGNPRTQVQALFRVCIDVYAPDGTSVTLGPGLAQSHDYGDKAVYQAQQNAFKYVLLEAFAIPTQEPDQDARQSDPIPEPLPESEVTRQLVNRLKAKALDVAGDKDTAAALYAEVVGDTEVSLATVEALEEALEARRA